MKQFLLKNRYYFFLAFALVEAPLYLQYRESVNEEWDLFFNPSSVTDFWISMLVCWIPFIFAPITQIDRYFLIDGTVFIHSAEIKSKMGIGIYLFLFSLGQYWAIKNIYEHDWNYFLMWEKLLMGLGIL
jgi:hypothetical protein